MIKYTLATRNKRVPRSFIREILKVAGDPDIISFAGGLPNASLFPVKALQKAANDLFHNRGAEPLQYAASEGFEPLREWICRRYKKRFDLEYLPENVLITTGSQQALDLAGKVFLEDGRAAVMERPGYLGAIQAFSLYTDRIIQVPMEDDGLDLNVFEGTLKRGSVGLVYVISNFQNPSGSSYNLEKRKAVARICAEYGVVLLEDDPYGELRFSGEDLHPVTSFMGSGGILLGTFSKIGVPGFRIGWMVAEPEILDSLIVVKQAADLHTSAFDQQLAWQYLENEDIDKHIQDVRELYGRHCALMVSLIDEHFPAQVRYMRPDGGMFLWVTLPDGCSSVELFDAAVRQKVAFVPGTPFHADGGGENTMRLNFSNADERSIEEGIRRLGKCIKEYLWGKSGNKVTK
jgi:2-aminoadipate transaminase